MHEFGVTNATITEWYSVADLSKTTVGGEPVLSDPAEPAHKIWFEHTLIETRQVGGDLYEVSATIIGQLLESIKEGDIITVLEDSIGSESVSASQKYRIESLKVLKSVPFVNSRIRNMELLLSEYSS